MDDPTDWTAVRRALRDYPTLVLGTEGRHSVIAVVDRPPAPDDPGDVVCTHPATNDGLAAAIQCAEAGANPYALDAADDDDVRRIEGHDDPNQP